jgi:predicted nucleic acid-binding Zn ribbon protein
MTWKRWSPVDDSGDDVRPIGDSVAALAKHLGLTTPNNLIAVFGDWEAMVGSVLAEHVKPERLQDGELVVVVDEPAWATEFRFLATDIAAKFNEAQGSEVIRSVTIRVARAGPNRSRFSGKKPLEY